jgi:hypothetical protein
LIQTAGIEGYDKIIKELPKEALSQPQETTSQPFEENPLVANLPEDQKRLFYEVIAR